MTNFGNRPYCGGFLGLFAVPEKTPCYSIVECSACGREVWYRHSRVDPCAWKIGDFEKEFWIDQKNKRIESK